MIFFHIQPSETHFPGDLRKDILIRTHIQMDPQKPDYIAEVANEAYREARRYAQMHDRRFRIETIH